MPPEDLAYSTRVDEPAFEGGISSFNEFQTPLPVAYRKWLDRTRAGELLPPVAGKPVAEPSVPTGRQAAQMMGPEALRGVGAQVGPLFQGSGKLFTKHANEAIGTGEGVQAFGWGHYFSESPGVAKSYRIGKYSQGGKELNFEQPHWQEYVDALEGYSPKEQIKVLSKDIENVSGELQSWSKAENTNPKTIDYLQKDLDFLQTLVNEIKAGKPIERKKGPLYTVTLHKGKKPGEYTYIDWENGVGKEVAEKINKKLAEELPEYAKANPVLDTDNARYIYNNILKLWPARQRSEFLQQAGISGIKYPAGTLSGWQPKINRIIKFADEAIQPNDPRYPFVDYVAKKFNDAPGQKDVVTFLKSELAEQEHWKHYAERTFKGQEVGSEVTKKISILNELLAKAKSGAAVSVEKIASKPKYNYVVFNPDDITIERVFKGRQK